MKSQILSLAIICFSVISCGKNDKISPTPDSKSAEVAKVDSTNTEAKTEVAQPNQVQVETPAPTTAGLNPEHGMPGHRCDIPVGQPLNSAPAPTVGMNPAPTVQQVTPVAPQSQPAPPQAIGPKPALNPAHGEPHHDCAIPVGDPLT